MTATILLVDDDLSVRESLPIYFTHTSDLKVVGVVENGANALRWLSRHRCDLVLSDIHMPDMNGMDLLRSISSLPTPPLFVAMTAYDTDETMLDVLHGGGSGYIIKGSSPESIIQALRDALQGGTTLSPACIKRFVELSTLPSGFATDAASISLTATETKVLKLVREGMSNRQIASVLHYSEANIKKNVSSLLKKFRVQSRAQLIAKI